MMTSFYGDMRDPAIVITTARYGFPLGTPPQEMRSIITSLTKINRRILQVVGYSDSKFSVVADRIRIDSNTV